MLSPGAFDRLIRKVDRLERQVDQLRAVETLSVVASYSTNASQSIPHSSLTIVDWEDKFIDTHNAVTTGASWKFTAPVGGQYLVQVQALMAQTTAWGETDVFMWRLYKNGSGNIYLARMVGLDSSGGAQYNWASGCGVIELSVGDYIDFRLLQSSGGSLAMHADGNHNHCYIVKV